MSHVVYERINPPADVTQALAALDTACHAWTLGPVIITDIGDHPPPPPPSAQNDWAVTPQMACSMMVDPYHALMPAIEMTSAALLLLLILVGVFVWGTRIHRLPGFLIRSAARRWTRRAQ